MKKDRSKYLKEYYKKNRERILKMKREQYYKKIKDMYKKESEMN